MKAVTRKFIEAFQNATEDEKATYELHVETALIKALDENVTVLQSIESGYSDVPTHDARVLLSRMSGELQGYGEGI